MTEEEMSPGNDGRKRWDWDTKYPLKARIGIVLDAIYMTVVGLVSALALYSVWCGVAYAQLSQGCTACTRIGFNHYAFLVLGGVIGGLIFGVKYLYKVVAHGYWHKDRRLWRFFSPFIAGGVALAIGSLIDSGILLFTISSKSNSAFFSIGFISGYFADSAVGKMQDIARHVFASGKHTDPNG